MSTFEPYKEIRDSYPEGYRDAAALVKAAKKSAIKKLYLAVNNRFAGNTPATIAEILKELNAAT